MSALDRIRDWIQSQHEENPQAADSVFIIGLGRFGSAVGSRLVELGVEVTAIDTDPNLVEAWVEQLTDVRLADGTSAATLRQLGVTDFDVAIVAIGTEIEASILTTAALADAGVKKIWAKAMTEEHSRILAKVGAHEVVFPERQAGKRVANIVRRQVIDYFPLGDGFVLAELTAPAALHGRTLADCGVRQKYGVTIVCIKPKDGVFTYATAETLVQEGDLLVVAGTVADTERFVEFATR